jgi:gliding motility-associated-like protein
MKYFITTLYLISSHLFAYTQISKNWYFNLKAGIKFDSYPPSILLDGKIGNTNYASATINDNNGHLLFYSDGDSVWNRNHQVMPNGFNNFYQGNGGGFGAFISQFPNDSSKYYLFTCAGVSQGNIDSGYRYMVIDMSLNGGLGAVVGPSKKLYSPGGERFTAVNSSNGSDYWVVTKEAIGNGFRTYKVSCTGINETNPIFQNIGTPLLYEEVYQVGLGFMKPNPQGNKIVYNHTFREFIEIYQFDNNTGLLSNPIKIKPPIGKPYGMSFSPDGKLLYFNASGFNSPDSAILPKLYQCKVDVYDSATINNSIILITAYSGGGGQIQEGPDGRLYATISDGLSLSTIEKPNIYGIGCSFKFQNVFLGGRNHALQLPYFLSSQLGNANTQIYYSVRNDCRTVEFTGKTYIKGNNLSFKWKFTPTDSLTQIVPSMGDTTFATTSFTFPLGIDSFNVSLTVTSDTVCGIGRAGKLVVVKPPPPVANFGFTNGCNNLTLPFTDSSLLNFNPSISYQYAYKPVAAPPSSYTNFSTTASPTFTFPSYDTFTVRLIVTSSLSCVPNDTIEKILVLQPKPTANATYTTTCGSLQANFNNTSSITAGSITSHRWYIGNTLINSNASFIYSFTNYGNNTVKYVAVSNAGCVSDTFNLPVAINAKPITTLSFSNDSVCVNNTLIITSNATVSASVINNYYWQVDNSAINTTPTSTRIFNLPVGNYILKHWVTATNGCNSDTLIQPITVVSKPTVSITATNTCGSLGISLSANNQVINDAIIQYYIDYGNGVTATSNTPITSYNYITYGSYTIKYAIKSSIGCTSDTATTNILVRAKPTTNFTYNNNACASTNFTLIATAQVQSSTITNYYWQVNNDAVNLAATNSRIENLSAGNYSIKHWVQSALGCFSDTVIKSITVDAYPIINFTVQNTCTNKNILLLNNSTGTNLSYTWQFGDGTSSTQPVPTKNYTTANNYTIQLKATTQNGCADSNTRSIAIEAAPIAAFTATDVCLGKAITLQNNSTGNITNYTWNFGDGTTATGTTPAKQYNIQGNYTIQLTATSQFNCISTATQNISVQPVAIMLNTTDTTISQNQALQLIATGAANYAWQPSIYFGSGNANNTFTTSIVGVFPITVEGTTSGGCKGTATATIRVFSNKNNLWIPTIFTPNGDGVNDVLQITCTGVQQLKRFAIYNRFGELIYLQQNCNNQSWNGMYRGKTQPLGTYVYTYEAITYDGKIIAGKGTIVLAK